MEIWYKILAPSYPLVVVPSVLQILSQELVRRNVQQWRPDAQQVSTRMVVVAWIVLLVNTQPLEQIRAPHVVQDTLHPGLGNQLVIFVTLGMLVHLSTLTLLLLDAPSALLLLILKRVKPLAHHVKRVTQLLVMPLVQQKVCLASILAIHVHQAIVATPWMMIRTMIPGNILSQTLL